MIILDPTVGGYQWEIRLAAGVYQKAPLAAPTGSWRQMDRATDLAIRMEY